MDTFSKQIPKQLLQATALSAALALVYAPGYAQTSATIVVNNGETKQLDPASTTVYTSAIVNSGGTLTSGPAISAINGSLYELLKINAGGTASLSNATILNDISNPTGTNGRAVTVSGAGANATLTAVTVEIKAFSTNPSTDFNHAFTAGVGAENGGHVDIVGGSVKASGSKRTVGIQANNGGSISASGGLTIDTYNHFGHAVNAYSDPASPTAYHTVVNLDNVTISTHSDTYADGIQSANKGSAVNGNNVRITTVGTNSFGAEIFNGATLSLTGGSINTSGAGAAGARVYGGALGSGMATISGTQISTTGLGASGILAADSAEPTAGIVQLQNAGIHTTGDSAAGVQASYGSQVSSTNSTIRTEGAGAYGVYGSQAGAIGIQGGSITTSGGAAYGVRIVNSTAQTTLGAVAIAVSGKDSRGVSAEGGSVLTMNGGSVSSVGNDGGMALYATGDGSVLTANNTSITVGRTRDASVSKPLGVGAEAVRGGTIQLSGSSVQTTQDWNDGLLAYRGMMQATNTTIQTNGLASTGVKSWREVTQSPVDPYPGATAQSILSGGSVTTLGNESYGLLAQNKGSSITASNLVVTTSGSQSYGADAYNGGVLALNNVTISTSGASAHGLVMGGMSDTMRPGSDGRIPTEASVIAMTGGSITASGAGSSAVYLEDSGSVSLTGTSLSSAGATFTSQLSQAGQAQSITLGSGTQVKSNNGTLLQVNRSTAGADGTVALALQAGSFAQGNVYDLSGAKQVTVTKTGNAQWAGLVVDSTTQQIDPSSNPTPSNVNTTDNVVVSGTAPVTFTGDTSVGSFSGGTGGSTTFAGSTNVTGELIGAQGSTTQFNGPTTIGGSVTGGSGSTTTFSGASTTIGGGVAGTGGAHIQFSQTGTTVITGPLQITGTGSSTHGGTIDTPIILHGDTTVSDGASLGGNITSTGSIGGSGGTLNIGNSVGRQEYASSAGFTGNFFAEVNAAGKSDLLVIDTGNFDLSGINLTVGQENRTGGYVLNHDYTIIQTPGGSVQNTFQSTALDSSFAGTLVQLDPVKYGAQDVKVSLSVNNSAIDAKRAGFSRNQNATLDGVLSVAGNNASADAALQSTDSGSALNQLSGESYASTASALLTAGGLVQRTLTQRMQGNLGSGMRAGAPMAQSGGTMPAGAMPQSNAQPLWAQVVGNWNTLSDDGNAAKVRTDMGGVFVGGDAGVGAGWRVGGAFGYTNGHVEVDDRSSRSTVDSYTVSLYGGNSWAAGKGKVNFLAGAAYTWHSIDSRRSVTTGGNQTLKSSYDANTSQLFTELGYALPVGAHSVIEPYANVAWLNQHTQGFSESGGTAALSGKSATDSVTTFTLGLRGKTQLAWGADKHVTVFGGLGWRNASGDIAPTRQLSFIQGGGTSFRIAGAPIAKNAAVVDAGLEASVGRMTSLGLSYSGQYGGGSTDHAGMLYVRTRF